MLGTIQALIELQTIDDEVLAYKERRDDLNTNLTNLKVILDRIGGGLADKREKVAEATRFYSEKQIDLKVDAERMAVAKTKLTAVTRTKEYAAMQRELDNLRRKHADDEAELKRLAEAIEEYHVSIRAEESKLKELQAEVKREEASSGDRLTELNDTIAAIEAKKKDALARIPANLVSRYRRVLGKREGKAVIPAMVGKCTGCQIRLPAQQYILVQRGEVLQSCPSCQRFLYFDPTLTEGGNEA